MPQAICCVSSCSSTLSEGAALHIFPNPTTDYKRFATWVKNAGVPGDDVNYIHRNRRICNLHFEEIYRYPRNRLNRLAIPTLNLPGISAEPKGKVEVQEREETHKKLLEQPLPAPLWSAIPATIPTVTIVTPKRSQTRLEIQGQGKFAEPKIKVERPEIEETGNATVPTLTAPDQRQTRSGIQGPNIFDEPTIKVERLDVEDTGNEELPCSFELAPPAPVWVTVPAAIPNSNRSQTRSKIQRQVIRDKRVLNWVYEKKMRDIAAREKLDADLRATLSKVADALTAAGELATTVRKAEVELAPSAVRMAAITEQMQKKLDSLYSIMRRMPELRNP